MEKVVCIECLANVMYIQPSICDVNAYAITYQILTPCIIAEQGVASKTWEGGATEHEQGRGGVALNIGLSVDGSRVGNLPRVLGFMTRPDGIGAWVPPQA